MLESKSAKVRLRQTLGLSSMFTLSFGAIIGIGWITMLGVWVGSAGSLGAIAAFVLGGGVMILIAYCYAEASAAYPASGGDVVYAQFAFGNRAAFFVGWLLILIYVIANAFLAASATWIVSELVPSFGCGSLRTTWGMDLTFCDVSVAQGGLLLLGLTNIAGAHFAAKIQNAATYALLCVAFAFIVAGVINGNPQNLAPFSVTQSGGISHSGFLTVLMTTPLWYAGFNVVPQAMGERDANTSARGAANAMLLGILAAVVFYALVILSASMVLPRNALLSSTLPAAAAFEAAFHSKVVGIVALLAGLLGLLTSWNAALFAGARALFALGEARLLPEAFARVHSKFGTPYVGLIFLTVSSMIVALVGRNGITRLTNVGGVAFAILYLIACIVTIRLRYNHKRTTRPYTAPLGLPLLYAAAICSAAIVAIAFWSTAAESDSLIPIEWVILAAWFTIGAAVQFAISCHTARRESNSNSITDGSRLT